MKRHQSVTISRFSFLFYWSPNFLTDFPSERPAHSVGADHLSVGEALPAGTGWVAQAMVLHPEESLAGS